MVKTVKVALICVVASFAVGSYGYVNGTQWQMILGFGMMVLFLANLSYEIRARKGLRAGQVFYDGEVEVAVTKDEFNVLCIGGYCIELASVDERGLAVYQVLRNMNVGTNKKPSRKDVSKMYLAYNIYTKMVRMPDGKILDPKTK